MAKPKSNAFKDAMKTVNSVEQFAKDVNATPTAPKGKVVTGPAQNIGQQGYTRHPM